MDVFAAINGRYSVRSYQATEVEEEKLKKVLDAGRLAPSANNRQEWKFILVRNAETRQKLAAAACGQSFVAEAPAVIIACATESEHVMTCGQPAYTVDVSIALAFMLLEAYELGLGTCWLGAFNEREVKKVVGIPDSVRVVAMTPVGYPAQAAAPVKKRKSFDQVVVFEGYR